ncbi:hypothetical protein BGZ96_009394 [Linnemannia gamsii]|uniref:Ig-like domain-containing protein n=1 Tax=Linnemannia gamsii TaxID=64522 RepID=A0ABQ7JWB1_9FUNG|nr:hypothetical protein BGZ96_009394 [Linnemannia gamsii]
MRPTSSAFPLSSAILLLTLTATQASITCTSPSSSTLKPGDSLVIRWGDSGSFPRASDVYSTDATISCSSGSQITKLSSISNGQSWDVPGNVLDMCQGGGLDVELSGTHYDMIHLVHWYGFDASCGRVQIVAPAPEPAPEVPRTTTTTTTTAGSSTTTDAAAPDATSTTAAVTTATGSTAIPTITLTPGLNGTIPGVLPPTAPVANPEATSNINNTNSPNDPTSNISSSSSTPDSPASKSGGPSKAALGALGAVGGLAAIAVVIFGFVLYRRRQRRQAREQRWMDHNYSSPSMSDQKGSGGGKDGYAFASGPGAGGAAGLSYLEEKRDDYTAYHNPDEITSSVSASRHVQSAEYVITHPAPPADRDNGGEDDDTQREMSPVPPRPARTYQGDFDDATTPWEGQLGYVHTYPQLQQVGGDGGNLDLGFEYIQDYIPITPHVNHQSFNSNDNNTTNDNNDRQLSMRASSQLPADLEYISRLREASWPMLPTSPTHPSSQNQSSTMTTTGQELGQGQGLSGSPIQMPYLLPLATSVSHSGAHQYDGNTTTTSTIASGTIIAASSSRHREDAAADGSTGGGGGGNQFLTLNGDSTDADVGGDGDGDGLVDRSGCGGTGAGTVAAAAAAADQHRMLSMRYGFENA